MSKRGGENPVEMRLKWLEGFGFKVLKLVTPGHISTHDRLILAPTWSPAPPCFVEVKAPGKSLRAAQAYTGDNWRNRGCDVRPFVDTEDKAIELCDNLLVAAVIRYRNAFNPLTPVSWLTGLPDHVRNAYHLATQRLDAKQE